MGCLLGVSPAASGCPLQRRGVGAVGGPIAGRDSLDFGVLIMSRIPARCNWGDAAGSPSSPSGFSFGLINACSSDSGCPSRLQAVAFKATQGTLW